MNTLKALEQKYNFYYELGEICFRIVLMAGILAFIAIVANLMLACYIMWAVETITVGIQVIAFYKQQNYWHKRMELRNKIVDEARSLENCEGK